MIKKISCLIAVVFLCVSLMIPAFALGDEIVPRLADGADILTESQEENILEKLDSVSEKHDFDVVIITVETLDGSGMTAEEFADDTYDYNNFGFGNQKNGILLLVDMEKSEWFISTTGYGNEVFTYDGWNYIGEQMKPYLSDGDFVKAFETYADLCDDFLDQAQKGQPYTSKNLPRGKLSLLWIPGSILIGMGISFMIMLTFRGQLKSVRRKPSANDYQIPGSMQLTQQSEMFLYQNVTCVPRQTQNTSSRGGGMRTGSSGRVHGGGGGKF